MSKNIKSPFRILDRPTEDPTCACEREFRGKLMPFSEKTRIVKLEQSKEFVCVAEAPYTYGLPKYFDPDAIIALAFCSQEDVVPTVLPITDPDEPDPLLVVPEVDELLPETLMTWPGYNRFTLVTCGFNFNKLDWLMLNFLAIPEKVSPDFTV